MTVRVKEVSIPASSGSAFYPLNDAIDGPSILMVQYTSAGSDQFYLGGSGADSPLFTTTISQSPGATEFTLGANEVLYVATGSTAAAYLSTVLIPQDG